MGDTPDYSVQPRPLIVDGAESVHDWVIKDLEAVFQPGTALEAASAAMRERKEYGLKKYGTVLHVDNGRDHLADTDDELRDAVCYLRLVLMQNPEFARETGLFADYQALLMLMAKVRYMIKDPGF